MTEGAATDARLLRDPRGVAADHGFRVLEPFRDGEEAALHLEGCGRSWAAIVLRRICQDSVGVVEGPAREKESRALRQHLVAMPFEAAEVVPALGPVGLEDRRGADALQSGNLVQECDEPGDEQGEGREPVGPDRVDVVLVLVRFDLHGRIITPSGEVGDARVRTCVNRSA